MEWCNEDIYDLKIKAQDRDTWKQTVERRRTHGTIDGLAIYTCVRACVCCVLCVCACVYTQHTPVCVPWQPVSQHVLLFLSVLMPVCFSVYLSVILSVFLQRQFALGLTLSVIFSLSPNGSNRHIITQRKAELVYAGKLLSLVYFFKQRTDLV